MEKKKDNVVPFPNLKQRLLDKGMEALQNKKFDEALEFLQQTLKFDDPLDEVQFGIVICLFELGHLEEAKERCQMMLQQDLGDYYDVLQLYLTILIQLRKYEEVEATIEAVLQEDKIPPQTVENFYRLLDFSRKMTSHVSTENSHIEVEKLLDDDVSIPEQWNIIQVLKNESQGISYTYPTLDRYLLNETKHPMLKTAILQMFIEKDIFREVIVEKFGHTLTINSSELHDIETHSFTTRVLQALDGTLGNENPSLYDIVKEMWFRHLYVMYPFNPHPQVIAIWAAGLHKVGYDLHGIEVDLEEIATIYQIATSDLLFSSSRIRKIEEISFLDNSF
jgi:tetratricopeptide (TPR) repeat protein